MSGVHKSLAKNVNKQPDNQSGKFRKDRKQQFPSRKYKNQRNYSLKTANIDKRRAVAVTAKGHGVERRLGTDFPTLSR